MLFIALGLLTLGFHAFIYTLGIALAWRQQLRKDPPSKALPVSILKPIAGLDDGLEDNLRSFFLQAHAAPFEIVFCLEKKERIGAAARIVDKLIAEFPNVPARVVTSNPAPTDNPKIANLLPAAAVAAHDLVLVSDSNIRVLPDYLTGLTSHYEPDVGVVCSCIVGTNATNFGATVDQLGLNTFYHRGMFISLFGNEPATPGKGMLFSLRTVAQFGGLGSILHHFADDYLFGKGVQKIKARIVATRQGVTQYMGNETIAQYIKRQVRWSQIRRVYGALAYCIELISMNTLLPAILGGLAVSKLFDVPATAIISAIIGAEIVVDALLVRKVGGPVGFYFPLAWFGREALAFVIWILTWTTSHIEWRGRKLGFDEQGRVVDADEPFTRTPTGEPHHERRRFILKDHPRIRALMGPDIRTALVTYAVVPTQLAIAWGIGLLASNNSVLAHPLALFIYAYTFGAILTHWLGMTIHETSHDLAFKYRPANRWLALLANVPMVVPIAMTFHRYHIDHHALLGVEHEDTDLPTVKEAKIIGRSRMLKFLWLSVYFFVYSLRGLTFAKRPNRAEVGNFVMMLLINALIVYAFGWTALAYLSLSVFFAHSLHPVAAHFIHEHYIFAAPQETYSYYGPLNWVTFNVGYHVEHHDFMNVAGWRLPELHAIGEAHYKPLVSHRSWTKVLATFIFSKDIGVDSRIIREKADYLRARTTPAQTPEHDWKAA